MTAIRETHVLITGGNAGIGYFVAEQLAAAGAVVILGSRDPAKAANAATAIRQRVHDADVRHLRLDLSDLDSLATIDLDRLDAIVCNAGVYLDGPDRRETKAGHELMFGTNHLGHFALVGRLAKLLDGGRVVTTGSFAARDAVLDLDDLQSTRDYRQDDAYARSKLAQMLFGFELDRRLSATGSTTVSVVNHPGGALDSLTPSRPPVHTRGTAELLKGLPACVLLQGKHEGARPAVHAVLGDDVRGGQLWGPRVFGLRGKPRLEPLRAGFADAETAARLWEASVELTGVDPFSQ